jgi:hypothetical protein
MMMAQIGLQRAQGAGKRDDRGIFVAVRPGDDQTAFARGDWCREPDQRCAKQ